MGRIKSSNWDNLTFGTIVDLVIHGHLLFGFNVFNLSCYNFGTNVVFWCICNYGTHWNWFGQIIYLSIYLSSVLEYFLLTWDMVMKKRREKKKRKTYFEGLKVWQPLKQY